MARDRTHTVVLSVILSVIAGLLCLGLTLAYFGGRQIVTAIKTAGWAEVTGRIIESEVIETTSRPRMFADEIKEYSIQLSYEYRVGTEVYRHSRIAIGTQSPSGQQDAASLLKPYPVGKNVTVFYDPAAPNEACLVSGAGASAYYLFIGGVVATCLVARMSIGWLREFGFIRPEKPESPNDAASI